MTQRFKIDFEKKHLLINDGSNRILIDTGSPATIHTSTELHFAGKNHHVSTNILGNTVEKLKAMAGIEFTTLMGLDILSEYKIIIDYASSEITLYSPDECDPDGTAYPIKSIMGTLVVPIEVANRQLEMILDTGATYSYIKSSITQGLNATETITDFSPLVGGEFRTPIFELESRLGNRLFMCHYGNLPQKIEMMIGLLGVDGVIGYDLLLAPKLLINIPNSRLVILNE